MVEAAVSWGDTAWAVSPLAVSRGVDGRSSDTGRFVPRLTTCVGRPHTPGHN